MFNFHIHFKPVTSTTKTNWSRLFFLYQLLFNNSYRYRLRRVARVCATRWRTAVLQ